MNAQTAPAPASLAFLESHLRLRQQRRRIVGRDGRVEQVIEWGGGDFRCAYDTRGDLVMLVEADGRVRRYSYDGARRLVTVTHLDGSETRYRYDERDRLAEVDDRGAPTRYRYDGASRLERVERSDGEAAVYRYDGAGRVVLARTSQVTTRWQYDAAGRAAAIEQSIGGVTISARLRYDAAGRLEELTLPGCDTPMRYTWDARARPRRVALGHATLARFAFDDTARTTRITLRNGLVVEQTARAPDGRTLSLRVARDGEALFARRMVYDDAGQVVDDGEHSYRYDTLGRLVEAQDETGACQHRYAYDPVDNLIAQIGGAGATPAALAHDRWGRLTHRRAGGEDWEYRYDGAGLLREVRRSGMTVAAFLYDHKGRLAQACSEGRVERYLYGDADDLLAVTDGEGSPIRLPVRTPLGTVAEVQGAIGVGPVHFRHDDERGTTRLVTDEAGAVIARFDYTPFGLPCQSEGNARSPLPCYTTRPWLAAAGLYWFGARWYDPALGRFLTPDTWTGAPDDARLVNPLTAGRQQGARRDAILSEWLKEPRLRNRYAFCANDPIGHVDPNGHWSFGGVLLMLLGAIWTLPNTLFGILVEITCLVGEVMRWIVWLFSGGNVSWETPGFDAAASGNLNAFALVFTGGWLGSFPNLLGITFGNVFFVYKQWETSPHITSLPDPIHPPAYNGTVAIPRQKMLYEHELRHTNQYGWLGPFFHLGLPLFGFYEWDVIINGYEQAWTERDARAHAEP